MKTWCEYLDGVCTAIVLPEATGKFPTGIMRCPYVDGYKNWEDEKIPPHYAKIFSSWVEHGYAVVYQHCRGRGKSHGEFIPFVHERKDGLALQAWIRQQDFYNGELFLKGGSYTTTVHYVTAPFAPDIKGAVFNVQDTDRYRKCYRNCCFKRGLYGDWYAENYKAKTMEEKHFDKAASFEILPLTDFCKTVFGEAVPELQEIFLSPNPTDALWDNPEGGADTRHITDRVRFPVLLTTGFYDVYSAGMIQMWRDMSLQTRTRSALVISPYDHGDGYDVETFIFPKGKREEAFGKDYEVEWCDAARGKGTFPVEQGKITYYRLFENVWSTGDLESEKALSLPLIGETTTYRYDPNDAPRFEGGLCTNFDGTAFQKKQDRQDVVTVYTAPFGKDTFVRGQMSMRLPVVSDCEDTCFCARISLETEKGDFGLRDDITTLVFQLGDYTPNEKVTIRFTFDEHAFLVKKGQRLRVDIASADKSHYVRHTNCKGHYALQTETKIATNTVYIPEAVLTLPVE